MALLTRSRRPLALVALILLAVPALAMLGRPIEAVSPAENRRLAPVPAVPQSPKGWRTLPRALDAFAADHFAFRLTLARRAQKARKWLGGRLAPQAQVTEGAGGRLLLLEGLLRSTGQEVDPARAADYAAFVCAAAARLKAEGKAVAFGLAPSPTSIYPQRAPAWALPVRRPSEYDLILARTRPCAPTVDLRAALLAQARAHDLYMRTDTHWTNRAALIGLTELARAAGRPELAPDPAALGWKQVTMTWGDLPRLAGRPAEPEVVEMVDLPIPERRYLTPSQAGDAPFVMETGRPGPTVAIVGDSFSNALIPFLGRTAGRIVWLGQADCGFDWRLLEAQKPEVVFLTPTERRAYCLDGRRPAGF